jgi:hypothetical protein
MGACCAMSVRAASLRTSSIVASWASAISSARLRVYSRTARFPACTEEDTDAEQGRAHLERLGHADLWRRRMGTWARPPTRPWESLPGQGISRTAAGVAAVAEAHRIGVFSEAYAAGADIPHRPARKRQEYRRTSSGAPAGVGFCGPGSARGAAGRIAHSGDFVRRGELAFRVLERDLLLESAGWLRHVIATGGARSLSPV